MNPMIKTSKYNSHNNEIFQIVLIKKWTEYNKKNVVRSIDK